MTPRLCHEPVLPPFLLSPPPSPPPPGRYQFFYSSLRSSGHTLALGIVVAVWVGSSIDQHLDGFRVFRKHRVLYRPGPVDVSNL